MPKKLKMKKFPFLVVLKSLDISIALFIVTPILVGNFFSLWKLLDFLFLHHLNNDGIQEKIISFVAGICGQFALLFYQDALAKVFFIESNGIILVFMSRVVILLISNVVNVCFWRTIWISYDSIAAVAVNSILMNIIQNSVILMALRVYRNLIASPFVVLTDENLNFLSGGSRTFLGKNVSVFELKMKNLLKI